MIGIADYPRNDKSSVEGHIYLYLPLILTHIPTAAVPYQTFNLRETVYAVRERTTVVVR
jgi:hypothetical protein